MRARSTRLAASVRERATDVSLTKSSSPSANSIARRHATMTFDLLARIKSHFTSHRSSDESHPTDPFLGIDELVPSNSAGAPIMARLPDPWVDDPIQSLVDLKFPGVSRLSQLPPTLSSRF